MKNKKTDAMEYIFEYKIKIRGIKQNVLVDQCLPYETFRAKVMRIALGREATTTLVWQHIFRPDLRAGTVTTGDIEKLLDVVVQKGLVDEFFDVMPFGY